MDALVPSSSALARHGLHAAAPRIPQAGERRRVVPIVAAVVIAGTLVAVSFVVTPPPAARAEAPGKTELVSTPPPGGAFGSGSPQFTGSADALAGHNQSISADGRFVVFADTSPCTACPGTTTTATTTTTTTTTSTPAATGASPVAVFSISVGPAPVAQVYRTDRLLHETVLVSQTPAGRGGGGDSLAPVISADGSRIAFVSFDSELGGPCTRANPIDVASADAVSADVLLADMGPAPTKPLQATHPRSLQPLARPPAPPPTAFVPVVMEKDSCAGHETLPGISGDGRFVAWNSVSLPQFGFTPCLVVADSFISEPPTVKLSMIAHVRTDAPEQPSLSTTGRYVTWGSHIAPGSVAGSDFEQVYFDDRDPGETNAPSKFDDQASFRLVSTAFKQPEQPGGGPSSHPSMSSDGMRIAFQSKADDLTDSPVPTTSAIFVRDRDKERTIGVSGGTISKGSLQVMDATLPSISGDGLTVAYTAIEQPITFGPALRLRSAALPALTCPVGPGSTTLAPTLAGGPQRQIFVMDLATSDNAVLSTDKTDTKGDCGSTYPSASGDGRYISFLSDATNLVAGDLNGATDLFVRDRTPMITVTPNPADFGTLAAGSSKTITFTARNSGSGPGIISSVTFRTAQPLDPGAFVLAATGTPTCMGATLHRGASCTIDITFTAPDATASYQAVLVLADDAPGAPHSVPISAASIANARPTTPTTGSTTPTTGSTTPPTVTTSTTTTRPPPPPPPPTIVTPPLAVRLPPAAPTLVVSPAVGPPEFVTVATGTGFVPNSVVVLTWDHGIGTVLVATDGHGGFQTGILIFDHDLLGPRKLLGTDHVNQAFAPFLVVPTSVQPSRFVVRR